MSGTVVRQRPEYGPDSRHSYLWDTALATVRGNQTAHDRLRRHAVHDAPERHRRAARDQARFDAHLPDGAEVRTNPDTDLGTGGEFSPPLWLIDRFASKARAGRPLGDLLDPLPLPPGVQQINVPRITAGSLAGPQTGDGAPLPAQDLATTHVGSPVDTIGGVLNVSQQLEDQAPGGFDLYAFPDLRQAYNAALEYQILFGTGAGDGTGHALLGVTGVPGITNITGGGVTTTGGLLTALGQAFAGVTNTRDLPPEAWLWAGRRWAWLAAQTATGGLPIVPIGATGPRPNEDTMEGGARPFGPVMGLPVYLDGAIPAGTAADTAICLRPSDMLLWESDDKTLVTVEALSGTLQVRITLARFVAFLPNRYPSGIGIVSAIPAPSGF